jgi:hypothetical protein
VDNLRGNGGADVFVFLVGSGKDTLSGFSGADNGQINVNANTAGIANAAMVAQVGASVLVALDGGNTSPSSISAGPMCSAIWCGSGGLSL